MEAKWLAVCMPVGLCVLHMQLEGPGGRGSTQAGPWGPISSTSC